MLQKEKLLDTKIIMETSMSTGEVITYQKNIYDEQIHRKNVNYKLSEKKLHQYLNTEVGSFFFLFYKNLDKIDIKEQYKTRFIYLSSYIDYNTNNLIDIRGGKKVSLSYAEIKTILNLSDKVAKSTIKVLKDVGLLIKDNETFSLNNSYCLKGNTKSTNSEYIRIFIEGIRKLYINTNPQSHKQLYYLFKLLPYVNLQFNVLTIETDKENYHDITPINMVDICRILNVNIKDQRKMYNILKSFMIGDEYVICKHMIDDMDAYSINPKLYYMGTQINNLLGTMILFDMAKSQQK